MLDKTFQILKDELLSDPKKTKQHMDWMHYYIEVQGGGDISHVAAGEALAATAVSVALLTQDPKAFHDILVNPRDGQVGREDFRYAFAHHTLLFLIQSYDKDDLSVYREHLVSMDKIKILACLVKELAYQGGELAEILGLQKSDF